MIKPLVLLWGGRSLQVHLSSKSQGSPVVGEILVSPTIVPSQLQTQLPLPDGSRSLLTLLYSSADACFIDEGLVQQLGLERFPLLLPVPAMALVRHILGTVMQQTLWVPMLLSGNHHQEIQFHMLKTPFQPLILGYPWFRQHNPKTDWATGAIRGWGPSCHYCCLKQPHLCSIHHSPVLRLTSPGCPLSIMTSVKSPIRLKLHHCPLIGLTIAPLTSCLACLP